MTIPALSFNEAAELYHGVRPRYPQELFADLSRVTGLPPGSRVLEIGAGTGIGTAGLIRDCGFDVTALEPGAAMAAVLCRQFPGERVELVTSTFEEWELPPRRFDLVIAFTAFHWLDPRTRFARIAETLSPGGWLGIVRYRHVAGGDRQFFAEVQQCYRRYRPGSGRMLPEAEELAPDTQGLEASGLFAPPAVLRYHTEHSYDRAAYEHLLLTFSDHRTMEAQQRTQLLHCIGALIDGRCGGVVRKQYLHELILARRL